MKNNKIHKKEIRDFKQNKILLSYFGQNGLTSQ